MNCCSNHDKNDEQPAMPVEGAAAGARSERLTLGGSVIAAVLSSACCWLPLLLLAFGASAAGVSAFFERWRPVFLVIAVALLGVGFYVIYFRKAPCCAQGACEAAPHSRRVVNQAMLWVTVVLVAAFALFPKYIGLLRDAGAADTSSAAGADATEYVFTIEGMSCEACAVTLRHELGGVEGVIEAQVDYTTKTGTIRTADINTNDRVLSAASRLGYTATLRGR